MNAESQWISSRATIHTWSLEVVLCAARCSHLCSSPSLRCSFCPRLTLATQPGLRCYALGQDAEGEIYVLDKNNGTFNILVRTSPPPPSDFPIFLSEIPALLNAARGIDQTQMNANFTYPGSGVTDNQIRTLEHLGLFDLPLPAPPSELPSAPDPNDTTATTIERAEAYVMANCSMCHQPGGPTPFNMDFRWDVPMEDRNIFGVVPEAPATFGIPNPRRFAPGSPFNSVMIWRMLSLDPTRMPPLGTSRVDIKALGLISAWARLMTTLDGPHTIWVDFENSGTEFGTPGSPFNTVSEGANNVAADGTVLMIPGNSPETPTINKPSTLKSTGGPVRIGTP